MKENSCSLSLLKHMKFSYLLLFLFLSPFLGFASLEELNNRVKKDLSLIECPPSWTKEEVDTLDVAIIGAGMSGTACAFALKQLGISNIMLFDQNPEGFEGPWLTYAHMKILRSDKCATGPCLFIPSLTFQAWYEAKYGEESWETLQKPSTKDWMAYLYWYRTILNLPVTNQCVLKKIQPLSENLFELYFDHLGATKKYRCKKVILATGRAGFGGPEIPIWLQNVPKSFYSHTIENIDFELLKDKKVAILGCGASAFDAAGMTLEAGAKEVHLIFRRSSVPTINAFASFAFVGVEQGFHLLSDEQRFKWIDFASQFGIPPPEESLERIKPFKNFILKSNQNIVKSEIENNQINLISNDSQNSYDFLILATGFHVGFGSPELTNIMENICLWKDKLPHLTEEKLMDFPYLGLSYEFKEKIPGQTPYLKNIYCFNYGALLSHGLTSSSIDAISTGASRIAQGIAADFFTSEADFYFEKLTQLE